jgi:hypothetical protein
MAAYAWYFRFRLKGAFHWLVAYQDSSIKLLHTGQLLVSSFFINADYLD